MPTTGRNAKTSKTEKVAEYVEYDNFDYMKDIAADVLIAEYRLLTDQEDQIKERKKAIAPMLQSALTVVEQKAVRCGNLLLIECNGTTERRVSKEKLILHGVDPDVIKECETGGQSYTYIQVKRSTE